MTDPLPPADLPPSEWTAEQARAVAEAMRAMGQSLKAFGKRLNKMTKGWADVLDRYAEAREERPDGPPV